MHQLTTIEEGFNPDRKLLRFAIQYEPPAILLEYFLSSTKKYYHHFMKLDHLLAQDSFNDDVHLVVDKLRSQHEDFIGEDYVSFKQIERLVKKIIDNRESKASPPNLLDLLPKGDYNSSSETQLKLAKARMGQIFEKNVIRPGDQDYLYDKQVEFTSIEASEWDD